jgi:hypothetical protein
MIGRTFVLYQIWDIAVGVNHARKATGIDPSNRPPAGNLSVAEIGPHKVGSATAIGRIVARLPRKTPIS